MRMYALTIAFAVSISNSGSYGFFIWEGSMKKIRNFAEMAYIIGILTLAFGVTLMEKANLGISMVVAPAYLVSLKFNFLTFGMAEYILQAMLLIVVFLLVRKFKLSYCYSFITAVIYGVVLDSFMWLMRNIPADILMFRISLYILGMLFCSFGISMFFHTYLAPEVYELFVKEISKKFGVNITRFKIGYDCVSCAVAVIMSLAFFGDIRGVGIGTVLCAVINGYIIGLFSEFFEKHIDFSPKLTIVKYFEQ